jgi:hypothetical protein
MMARPPASFASRSWRFSRSESYIDASISRLTRWMRASMPFLVPAPSTMIVCSRSTRTRRARAEPRSSDCRFRFHSCYGR